MKKTHEILKLTEKEYDGLLWATYLNWAGLYCNNSNSMLQKILISQPINRWYLLEFNKLQTEFKKLSIPYLSDEKITQKDLLKLWTNTVTRVYEIYPKALLEQYKVTKTKIITQTNLN